MGSFLRRKLIQGRLRKNNNQNQGVQQAPNFPRHHYLHNLLSKREVQVLELVASDFTDGEIANDLCLSTKTVGNHLHHIYAKLGVKRRAGAVSIAIIKGIIDTRKLIFLNPAI